MLAARDAAHRAPLLDWIPGLRYALIVAACALGVLVLTGWARDRMARDAAQRAVCVAQLEALRARNPILLKGHMRRAEACADLYALTGER